MQIVKVLFISVLFLSLQSCSCSRESLQGSKRIGVDPNWYPLDFGAQEPYVNGYTEELLLKIARHSGMQFERLGSNWDSLLQGLKEEKYDAILTSLPPYEFNRAQFDFSENFLEVGPVLIVAEKNKEKSLAKMKGEEIGLLTGDRSMAELQKYPDLIPRFYPSIPELLNAVAQGNIEGALLSQIPAINYVRDLYPGKLQIASSPLNQEGLHLVTLKGKHKSLIKSFDQALEQMQRKKKLQTLQKKWNLA